ncbi:MAG: M14 family zinc carboxypeptidase [Phycisphaerae bacterium]
MSRDARAVISKTVLATALALLASRSPAPANAADVSVKPGDKIIRVDVTTPAELQQLLDLDLDIWSHEFGVGPIDVHVSTAERQAIEARGLAYTVLDDNLVATLQASQTPQPRGLGFFLDYHSYDQIVVELNNLASTRPDLASVSTIGPSVEGRDLWVIHITGPGTGPKPAVFYHGLQHAREWITGPMVMYLADHLINQYDLDPCVRDLVDNTDIYLAPVVNPDGYSYTWTDQRLWRKNRRLNADATYGVDLNRNWAYDWGGGGSSGTPSSEIYRGTMPFSEPETTALSSFIAANPSIRAYMDYHSYSQLILWPFGSQCIEPSEPDATTFWALGNAMQADIQAVHGQFYLPGPVCLTLYQASGNSIDWVYGDQGRIGFTIELRPTGSPGFLLPPAEILPTCEENLPAILRLTRWASSDILIDLPQGVPTLLNAAAPTVFPVTIQASWGNYAPGTALLHYRFDSAAAFSTVPLTMVIGGTFTASLPPGPCGATAEFYLTAASDSGFVATNPCAAPASVYSAPITDISYVLQDNFETDQGWTTTVEQATSGAWQRGVPVNDPAWAYGPTADGDGSGSCFLTENAPGNTDVDNGVVRLISPSIDMTAGNIAVSYDYFLRLTNQDGSDRLLVDINTNDGVGFWIEIARHDTDGGLTWRHHVIDQAALDAAGVTLTSATRIRFSANDADPQSIVEAGIDGFRVVSVGCANPVCAGLPGDLSGDGAVNGQDITPFLDAFLNSPFYDPCGDLAPPSGNVLDQSDLTAFVNLLLSV